MAKSKQQKQAEALGRLRKAIPLKRKHFLECQQGGKQFDLLKRIYGLAIAEETAGLSLRRFQRDCAQAKVDTSGNHLEDL